MTATRFGVYVQNSRSSKTPIAEPSVSDAAFVFLPAGFVAVVVICCATVVVLAFLLAGDVVLLNLYKLSQTPRLLLLHQNPNHRTGIDMFHPCGFRLSSLSEKEIGKTGCLRYEEVQPSQRRGQATFFVPTLNSTFQYMVPYKIGDLGFMARERTGPMADHPF